jgi:hypothetical protein
MIVPNANTSFIITIIASIIGLFGLFFSIFSLLKIRRVKKDLAVMFSGKLAKDLESIILAHTKQIIEIDKEIQDLFEISNKIHNLALKSIHKVGVVRFNPFKDIGGDQSFALALLDGKNSGLVISSLHTREGTRIYSKPVEKGESEKYTLTEEEQSAVKNAIAIKPNKI